MFAFIDCETGGLSTRFSLLETAVVITDKDLNVLDSIEVLVKPYGSEYTVSPDALKVNGIDLVQHAKKAMPYEQAKEVIGAFLTSYDYLGKLVPTGWNVEFDIRFMQHYLFGDSWVKYFSYKSFEVSSVLRLLQIMQKADPGLGSLSSCIKYFNVGEVQKHSARSDCMLTIDVLKEMMNRVQ